MRYVLLFSILIATGCSSKQPPPPVQQKVVTEVTTTPAAPGPVVTRATTSPSGTSVSVTKPAPTATPGSVVASPAATPPGPAAAANGAMIAIYLEKLSGHYSSLPSGQFKEAAANNDSAKSALAQGLPNQARLMLAKNEGILAAKTSDQPGMLKLLQAETTMVVGLLSEDLGQKAEAERKLKSVAQMGGFPDSWDYSDEVREMKSDASGRQL